VNERKYVGKGKIKGNYGDIHLGLRDLPQPNDKGYINLIVSKMRNPDMYGNECTVYVNDFVPQPRVDDVAPQQRDTPAPEIPAQPAPADEFDALPF
jgi:hypothetical protein